uniref:Uncharacterized protein n=1 Tax=Setaria italica TaxID=4555 RepID=K4A1B0_SETIT
MAAAAGRAASCVVPASMARPSATAGRDELFIPVARRYVEAGSFDSCFSVPAGGRSRCVFAGGGTTARRAVPPPVGNGSKLQLRWILSLGGGRTYWFVMAALGPAPWISVPHLCDSDGYTLACRRAPAMCIHEDLDGASARNRPGGTGCSSRMGLPCQKRSSRNGNTQFEAACRQPHPPPSGSCLHGASAARCSAHLDAPPLCLVWPFPPL